MRIDSFARMIGASEIAWPDAKSDFYLGFIARVLTAHTQMDHKARQQVPFFSWVHSSMLYIWPAFVVSKVVGW